MTNTQTSTPSHWKFVATIVFAIVILAVSSMSPLVFAWVKGAMATGTTRLSNIETGLQQLSAAGDLMAISILLSTLTCIPLIALFIKLKRGSDLRHYLALRAVPVKTYLIWGGFILLVSFGLEYVTPWLGVDRIPPFMIETYRNTNNLWLLLFAVVVAAPLWEELLFRGFLMRGLKSSFITRTGAVVVIAAIWSIIHFQYEWQYLLIVFIVGLLLGYARLRTGSVYVPIMMHALNNALAFGQLALLQDGL